MSFPARRLRRLRRTPALRELVAETRLSVDDLVAPLFVREGIDEPVPVASMPGVVQHTRESLRKEVQELAGLGVPAVILFGVPETKDPEGSAAWDPHGIVQEALRDLRAEVGDALVVMADLCLDEYTDHGHCGVLGPERPGRAENPGPERPGRAENPGPERPGRAENPGPERPGRAENPGPERPGRAENPGPERPGRAENPGPERPGRAENPGPERPGRAENPGPERPGRAENPGPERPGRAENPGPDGVTVDNDATLERYARVAVAQAEAGADVVAPSGMMDGQVGVIRAALDRAGHADVAICAYSAKYASALYGPFRDAVDVQIRAGGDRKGYQQDPRNRREALAEVALDVAEGADLVMVKPALAYLDVIAAVRERFDVPVAAFHVSGEYSMIKAAAERGWVDGAAVAVEQVTAVKRAGADLILTYLARELAGSLPRS